MRLRVSSVMMGEGRSASDTKMCVCVCAEGDGVKKVKMQPTWAVC